MKFKVGDKVQVITDRHGHDELGEQLGRIGVIIQIKETNTWFPIKVRFDNYSNTYSSYDLKHSNSVRIRERLGVK